MDSPGPINNVPEVLRIALEQPVTVVEGERPIACVVSVSYFAEIGGDPERLGVERFGEKTLAGHDMGSGTPDERSQRFCRLVLHASHAKAFVPLLVNGQPVVVVVPPGVNQDPSVPPSGTWIRIWRS
jgi:hypothetical protein